MKIKKAILALLLLPLIVLSSTSSNAANQKGSPFRFRLPKKGDQFIYKGIVKWEIDHKEGQKEVIRRVEVVDVVTRGNYLIAKINGFPDDLVGFFDFKHSDNK